MIAKQTQLYMEDPSFRNTICARISKNDRNNRHAKISPKNVRLVDFIRFPSLI